jgi:hypothetical protein
VVAAPLPQSAGKNTSAQESPAPAPVKKLTIEVTGGAKDVPVENASVYIKFDEARVLRKDKKFALNVKTNREGATHIPDVPLGKVLIQVVADGWKTFGQYYEISDPGMTIKIHLDRPPKWY